MRLPLLAGLLALLAAMGAASAQDRDQPGRFDFYVLALSWSPTYCAETKSKAQQCSGGKSHGFVVHGLWPQYVRGYPDFCAARAPYVPDATVDGVFDIMPSKGLILHEWRKHGTCTGLSPEAYFDLVRKARARIAIPEVFAAPTRAFSMTSAEIEDAFRGANPGLGADMVAVDCGGGRFREVRVCLTKDLTFTSCAEVDQRACSAKRTLSVPAVR